MKRLLHSFSKDAIWSILGGGIPALAGLLTIPILIHLLTINLFALTSLLISFNLFFFVYDVGLARAMHFFASKNAYLSLEGAGSLITSCLLVGFLIGLVLMPAFIFLSPMLVDHWLNIDVALKAEAILSFQLTAIGILPALLINAMKGNLEGRQLFRAANMAKMFSGVTLFGFPVIAAYLSNSLVTIAGAIVLSRVFSLLVYSRYALWVFDFRYLKLRKELVWKIVNYAFWAAVSGFFATLFVYGDRFIVAGYIDAPALAVYIACQDVLIRYLLIPWSIALVLAPYFASEKVDGSSFKKAYALAIKNISLLTVCFVITTLIILVLVVPIWLATDLVKLTQQLTAILMVGVVFAAFAQLPLIFLYAQGRAKLLSLILFGEGLLYLLIAPAVFATFGVIGAAFVWSSRLLLELLLLSYFSHRLLKIR